MSLYEPGTGVASSAAFKNTMIALDLATLTVLGSGVIAGLTVDGTGTVQTGSALVGHVVALTASVLPAYVPNALNYVYLQVPAAPAYPGADGREAGQVVVNQTGTMPPNSVLLATVQAGAGSPPAIASVNTGPAGRRNLSLPLTLADVRYLGPYAAATAYVVGNIVGYQGGAYMARTPNTGVAPVDGANWGLMSSPGTQGPQGVPGIQGATGAQGVAGPDGAQGAAGPAGTNGTNGTNGNNGATIRSGSGVPPNTLGADGDYFLNVATGDLYLRTGGTYAVPLNLKGPQGAQGAQGLQGATGAAGASGTNGANGAAGTNGTNGVNGTNGSVIRTGSGAPSNATGVDGDYYLNSATGDLYTRTSGAYTVAANIRGPQGAQGPAGSASAAFAAPVAADGIQVTANVAQSPNVITAVAVNATNVPPPTEGAQWAWQTSTDSGNTWSASVNAGRVFTCQLAAGVVRFRCQLNGQNGATTAWATTGDTAYSAPASSGGASVVSALPAPSAGTDGRLYLLRQPGVAKDSLFMGVQNAAGGSRLGLIPFTIPANKANTAAYAAGIARWLCNEYSGYGYVSGSTGSTLHDSISSPTNDLTTTRAGDWYQDANGTPYYGPNGNFYANGPAQSAVLGGTGDFSVEAYVQTGAATSGRFISSQGQNTATNAGIIYELGESASSGFRFGMSNAAGTNVNLQVGTVTANTLYHVVATYVASTQTMTLYSNGASIGSMSLGGVRTAPTASGVSTNIGTRDGAGASYDWDGRIYFVALYNRALPAAEVTARYNNL